MLAADQTTDFLLIHGSNDSSVPPSEARATVDLFNQNGRSNLTYSEYPTLDHGMIDLDGHSHLEAVLKQAALWLQLSLSRTNESKTIK
ncbi:prolyl oligopeptidase family serine peptidase [Cohaesibacter sp. ES.047]|uniref:prolyl oligopeptidase family serine peptidase n=1 Tax=Cohaesibacter sp. ES.047 TaxID=1798205 RepID=UPI000BB8C21F|nr:prolyl oligopeptidase family serine peptidase [Cohaesibacter sp. ES.047]